MQQKEKENGRWVKQYNDSDFYNSLEGNLNTPSEIAKVVGCKLSLAQKRLKSLHESGEICGQLVAGRWVYWK